jgi:hypothetical protein
MPRLVKHTVTLPAPSRKLYTMYLNPKTHGAITGGSIIISSRNGSKFSAFNDMLHRVARTIPSQGG